MPITQLPPISQDWIAVPNPYIEPLLTFNYTTDYHVWLQQAKAHIFNIKNKSKITPLGNCITNGDL